MIVNVKYFYERTDADYEEYNKQWDENKERMIFFSNLSLSKQRRSIINDISDNKDILAIRFPTYQDLKKNKIINNIISGNGFIYDNKIWYPKEVWIYSPCP